MKTKVLLTAILLTILAGMIDTTEARYGNVHFSYFYENLHRHGRWLVLDDDFIVWQPYRMSAGWAPYYRGSWVWTDYGWYWETDEPYGYIVYHYGRWHYDDYYGWIWVPDYEWAPAWVDWRYDDDYVGWAPLPPYAMFHRARGLYFTVNINIHFNHWHFVRYRHFGGGFHENYYASSNYKYRIYNHTRREERGVYYDNGVRNRGIDRSIIERRGSKTITQRNIVFGTTDDRRGGDKERVMVRTADFEHTRNIDVREMNMEQGRNRSTLNLNKVELGERRSRLNQEREKQDATRERQTEMNESRERGRIERSTNEQRTVLEIQERRRPEDRREEINRNKESREQVVSPRETRERESGRVTESDARNTNRERVREAAPVREPRQSRESEIKTRENSKTQAREADKGSTRTKERDRR